MYEQYGNQHLEPLGMELEDSLTARTYVVFPILKFSTCCNSFYLIWFELSNMIVILFETKEIR